MRQWNELYFCLSFTDSNCNHPSSSQCPSLPQQTLQWPTAWSQISSNFLARCYTTSAKTKSSKWGFTASFQSTAPLGAFLTESQTAAQLGYLADLPCHQLLQPESYTLSLYGHILAVNHWAEWTSLECLLGCQMIVCKSKQGPNLIGVRHISALSVMKVR